jgi:glycosyltransferase involved in cell wall biosynthesis
MNRISIVTICFNNLEDLKTTISHLDKQTLIPYEHIIIDGSTNSEIKEYLLSVSHPDYRTWISEPDKGISDAWNKGIKRCTGDIIHLHNSGDYYYDNTILKLVTETFEIQPKIKWLHGKYAQYKGGAWVYSGKPFEQDKLYRGFRTTGHPTMFVRKELYDKHGLFDTDIKISSDFDFLMRIANEPFAFIDYPLVVFTPGGASNILIRKSTKEMVKIYTKYKGFSIKNRLWLRVRVPLINYITETALGAILFRFKNKSKKLDDNIRDH